MSTSRRTWLGAAAVAAAFAFVVLAVMLALHARPRGENPFDDAAWRALKAELAARPDDAAAADRLRTLDLELRRAFFERREPPACRRCAAPRRPRRGAGGLESAPIEGPCPSPTRRPPRCPSAVQDRQRSSEPSRRRRHGAPDRRGCAVPRTWPSRAELALPADDLGVGRAERSLPTAEERARQWPSFRGHDGSGVAPTDDAPLTWDGTSGDHIVWKTRIPLPGASSPIVWGDRVFLTGATAQREEVYCLDAHTGAMLWKKALVVVGSRGEAVEPMEDTGHAAPTAATDGRNVFAMFASGRVAAFDMDGEQVWLRSFGPLENTYGHSSSLTLFENQVLLQLDQGLRDDKLARLVALNATTGKTVWETPRPVDSSWASPIVCHPPSGPQVVLSATPILAAYDPATGAEIWRADVLHGEVAPTPICRDGVVYVVHEDVGLFAVRTDGTGDVTKTHVSWNVPDGASDVASPLCDGERVYVLTTSGTLTCVRASSGEVVWEHELEADYYASPSLAGTRSLPDEHGGGDHDHRRRRHVHAARHESPRRGRLREHGVRPRSDLPAREGPPLRDRRSEIEPTSTDLRIVDRVVEQTGRTRSAVIPILQGLQAELRHLPEDALRRVCEITEITPADIVGVATFYDQFRFEPMGRNVLRVCHGTACHVKGSQVLQNAIDDHLGIPAGRDTDPDGRYTVQKVACLGCCTLAPVVQSEHATFGYLTPASVGGLLADVERAAAGTAAKGFDGLAATGTVQGEIRVGLGSCCVVKGTQDLLDVLRGEVARLDLDVAVRRVGCVVACYRTPVVEVIVPGQAARTYDAVAPDDAADIVRDCFRPRGIVRRARAAVSRWLAPLVEGGPRASARALRTDVRDPHVTAFLAGQVHIATENWGELDPLDFDQTVRLGGFQALRRVLAERDPDSVIDEVDRAGLRGRGGGGFPTARKWRLARDAAGDHKTVICNGDEGDPGAFMDRMLLESFPYRVIEGLTIAAYAVGARDGIFYIREEYPLAFARIREAIETARARGLPRCRRPGLGLRLRRAHREGRRRLRVRRGDRAHRVARGPTRHARAAAAVPGRARTRGPPDARQQRRDPGPAALDLPQRRRGVRRARHGEEPRHEGLRPGRQGRARRADRGADGHHDPRDRRGDRRRRARRGVQGRADRRAVGRLHPRRAGRHARRLRGAGVETGAMMGSGGLVVLDDHDCMVDMARYFLQFTQNESCGKCTFCRIGTRQMLDILERICRGRGRPRDLEDLEALARTTSAGSLCGLGHAAPNPVLTTLRYFRDEYEAHLEGRCPAGRCLDLITYHVTDACTGCTICAQHCPADAIPFTPYRKHEIDTERCTACDVCRSVCPEDAIEVR